VHQGGDAVLGSILPAPLDIIPSPFVPFALRKNLRQIMIAVVSAMS
jgi:hypothetical protein